MTEEQEREKARGIVTVYVGSYALDYMRHQITGSTSEAKRCEWQRIREHAKAILRERGEL